MIGQAALLAAFLGGVPAASAAVRSPEDYPLSEAQRARAQAGRFLRSGTGLVAVAPSDASGRLAVAVGAPAHAAVEALARMEGLAPLELSVPLDAVHPLRVSRGDILVEQRLKGAKPAAGEVTGGFIRYADALDRTDALFLADGTTVEQLFYLKDRHAPVRIELAMTARGARPETADDGSLEVRNHAGAAIFSAARPLAIDAEGRRRVGWWKVERLDHHRYVATMGFSPIGLRYPVLLSPRWRSASSAR